MVSFEYDEFLVNKDESILVITLDDGRVVYQDDFRNGIEDKFLPRFKEWLKKEGRYIVAIDVRFRSVYKKVLGEYPHYFISKGAGGFVATGIGNELFVIGYSQDGKTFVKKEITHKFLEEIREYEQSEGILPQCVFSKPKPKRGRKKKV